MTPSHYTLQHTQAVYRAALQGLTVRQAFIAAWISQKITPVSGSWDLFQESHEITMLGNVLEDHISTQRIWELINAMYRALDFYLHADHSNLVEIIQALDRGEMFDGPGW